MQAYLLISLLYKKDSLPMLQREDTSEANFDQKLSEICICNIHEVNINYHPFHSMKLFW